MKRILRESGFTLVEILVVISIISILSAIGLVVYQNTQASARNTIRKSDLNNLASALELYLQTYKSYYVSSNHGTANGADCDIDTNAFYSSNITNYLSDNTMPQDPSTNANYCYISLEGGKSYVLCANLENSSGSETNSICPDPRYNYGIQPK